MKKPRAKMACGKCGAIGFRADGCGRTHNTSPPIVERDLKPSNVSTPPPITAVRSDRFSRIEAAARARNGASQ